MGRTFDMSARKLWLALMELFATAMATNTPATAQQPAQKPNILLLFGFLLLATTLAGVELAAAAEKEMPKFDIAAVCRGSDPVETRAQCMQDEQAASDALARLWPQFKQYASRCDHIVTTGGAANYTKLLSCLQAASIEETPKDPFGPTPAIAK